MFLSANIISETCYNGDYTRGMSDVIKNGPEFINCLKNKILSVFKAIQVMDEQEFQTEFMMRAAKVMEWDTAPILAKANRRRRRLATCKTGFKSPCQKSGINNFFQDVKIEVGIDFEWQKSIKDRQKAIKNKEKIDQKIGIVGSNVTPAGTNTWGML